MRYLIIFALAAFALTSCEPQIDPKIDIGGAPSASITVTPLAGDLNRFVVETNSEAFSLLWDFGDDAVPKTSDNKLDTVYFRKMGNYSVDLFVTDRGGTNTASTDIIVTQDAANDLCGDDIFVALNGGCEAGDSATWIWSRAAAAVSVGPVPYSTEWFTSPPDGLVDDQYDDSWTFAVEGQSFRYENNGLTVFPEFNFEARPYDPPVGAEYELIEGAGVDGLIRIVLSPEESFIGVKDSGPIYDIVSIDDTSMVLLGEFKAGGGYFTLYFKR